MPKKKAASKKKESETDTEYKRLYRSRKDKVIAGVCGGIGEYFNVDPVWVRLVAILLLFIQGIGGILYILAWVLIPENPNQRTSKKNELEKSVDELNSAMKKKENRNAYVVLGGIFILTGILILARDIFNWLDFRYIWPLLAIGLGIFLLHRGRK